MCSAWTLMGSLLRAWLDARILRHRRARRQERPPAPGCSTLPAVGREAASTPPVFRMEGVGKTYRMGEVEVQALRGIDFELAEGELLVLLGPSGSGKSTLLNILGGLDVPTSGRVFFRDQELSGADRER